MGAHVNAHGCRELYIGLLPSCFQVNNNSNCFLTTIFLHIDMASQKLRVLVLHGEFWFYL